MNTRKNKKWFTVCECFISYRPHEVLAFDVDDAIDQVAASRKKQNGKVTPGLKTWDEEYEEGLIYYRFEWFVNGGKKKWIKDKSAPNRPSQYYLDYKNPLYRL